MPRTTRASKPTNKSTHSKPCPFLPHSSITPNSRLPFGLHPAARAAPPTHSSDDESPPAGRCIHPPSPTSAHEPLQFQLGPRTVDLAITPQNLAKVHQTPQTRHPLLNLCFPYFSTNKRNLPSPNNLGSAMFLPRPQSRNTMLLRLLLAKKLRRMQHHPSPG